MLKRIVVAASVVAAGMFAFTGCQTTPTQQGALVGGALGAGAGAIIGNQSHGHGGNGALIGAGVGALTGALVGDATSRHQQHQVQQQQVVSQQQAPPPSQSSSNGHWETRTVTTQSGETYEERVWVQER